MIKLFRLPALLMFACICSTSLHSVTKEQLIEYAINHNDFDIIEILLKYGDNNIDPVLNRAMQAKDYFAVSILVAYGVDINSRGINGRTVLEMAVDFGEISMIEYFLLNNADPVNPHKLYREISFSPHRRTDYYTTAIYDAIMKDRLDILILFVQYGVDLNKTCYGITSSTYEMKYEQSPLQFAIEKKKKDITAFLISIGVDI